MVPGVSEGVLPPNAKPVTAQEALHHLSKIVCVYVCIIYLLITCRGFSLSFI